MTQASPPQSPTKLAREISSTLNQQIQQGTGVIRALTASRANANNAEANRAASATHDLSSMITNMHAQLEKVKGPLDAAIAQANTATAALTQATTSDPYVKTSVFTPIATMTKAHALNPHITDPLPPKLHSLLTTLSPAQLDNLLTGLTTLSNSPPTPSPLESTERKSSREEIKLNLDTQTVLNNSVTVTLDNFRSDITTITEDITAISKSSKRHRTIINILAGWNTLVYPPDLPTTKGNITPYTTICASVRMLLAMIPSVTPPLGHYNPMTSYHDPTTAALRLLPTAQHQAFNQYIQPLATTASTPTLTAPTTTAVHTPIPPPSTAAQQHILSPAPAPAPTIPAPTAPLEQTTAPAPAAAPVQASSVIARTDRRTHDPAGRGGGRSPPNRGLGRGPTRRDAGRGRQEGTGFELTPFPEGYTQITWDLHIALRPTIYHFQDYRAIQTLNTCKQVTTSTISRFLASSFPDAAFDTTQSLIEIFPTLADEDHQTLQAMTHYLSLAAKTILDHPVPFLGALKDCDPGTNTYPMYNPLTHEDLRPVREELARIQLDYPLIPVLITPNRTTFRWSNINELLTQINDAWSTCGHHRLLFSVIYLAFPHLRDYIRRNTPQMPSHLAPFP